MVDSAIDMVVQGIDAFISAIFVSFIVSMMGIQAELSSAVSNQQNQAIRMQYYREYNAFDYKHVYSSDIVSCVLKYRGYPSIRVNVNGTVYTWTTDDKPVEYTTVALSNILPATNLYDADLVYADSSKTTVESISFKTCSGSCGR